MEKVYQYIEEHQEEYIEIFKKFCNQPSISTENVGIKEMAQMVKNTVESLGADVEEIKTEGYPIIYGEIDRDKERTLLFYNHYDVQPVEPLEEWKTDPFKATIIDGKLYARGAADNKGSMLSRICAVHAYQKVYGELPINVKFMIEGEEEVGSPNLKNFVEEHPDKVQADGLVWEGGSKNVDGPLQVALGVKGMCYVELRARGAISDLHSQHAAIVVNPAWRLIWALSTLKNEKDEILIEGFYDNIKPPTSDEMQFLEDMEYDEEKMLESRGLKNFINNLSGLELKEKFLYEPTCNICGIESGFTGEGSKTVLPSFAKVKIDFRLVYNQTPEEVLELLRKHLDKHGFEDIEIVYMSGQNPYRTDPHSALAKTVIENVERVYNMPPVVYRNLGGTTAMYDICEKTNIPAVLFGVGDDNSQIHAPNENVNIKDYIDGIKFTATVIHEFARTE